MSALPASHGPAPSLGDADFSSVSAFDSAEDELKEGAAAAADSGSAAINEQTCASSLSSLPCEPTPQPSPQQTAYTAQSAAAAGPAESGLTADKQQQPSVVAASRLPRSLVISCSMSPRTARQSTSRANPASSTLSLPAACRVPRMSVSTAPDPPAHPSSYTPLFSPKSPAMLRQRQKSELALRLGDVMGEISQHENEKLQMNGSLTHRLRLNGASTRLSNSVDVKDWKPYDDRTHNADFRPDTAAAAADSEHARSRAAVAEIRSREGKWAEWLTTAMSTMGYQYVCITLTLLSLYLSDLDAAVMPMSADTAVSCILLVIFILFSVELLLQCACKRNYLFSFFFFMDLIGTASLVFDISFIANTFLSSSTLTTSSTPSARVSHSASVVRLTRFARILRVVRLIRIVRLFRSSSAMHGRHPSKVGLHLSELIDKRVILMMLGLLIALPFLTVDPAPDDQSAAMALLMMVQSLSIADTQLVAQQLMSAQGSALFYLFIAQGGGGVTDPAGLTFIDQRQANSGLRVSELSIYSDGSSTVMLSIRSMVYETACYSMATTSLIIAVFALGSFIISRHVHQLVVAPLERMTQIIRKLAGTVCFLSAATEADQKEMSDGLETTVVESTIEKMANIFAVQPDGNSALPKPLQMMAGSKHTEILTHSSVVSIEVVERPKALQNAPIVDDGSVSDDRSGWQEVDTAAHRELSSIDEILTHPLLIPYFDLYLTSCFVNENLQFSLEVDRFRSIVRTHALHLYNSFISPRAHNSINVDGAMKSALADGVDEPQFALFDAAQKECLELMRGHWRLFLRSRWCWGYVRKAEEVERRRQRMIGKAGGGKEGRKKDKEQKEAEAKMGEELKRGAVAEDGEVDRVTLLPGAEMSSADVSRLESASAAAADQAEALLNPRDRSSSDDHLMRGAEGKKRRRGKSNIAPDFPGAVKEDE